MIPNYTYSFVDRHIIGCNLGSPEGVERYAFLNMHSVFSTWKPSVVVIVITSFANKVKLMYLVMRDIASNSDANHAYFCFFITEKHGIHVSVNDIIIKAVALALKIVPEANGMLYWLYIGWLQCCYMEFHIFILCYLPMNHSTLG